MTYVSDNYVDSQLLTLKSMKEALLHLEEVCCGIN